MIIFDWIPIPLVYPQLVTFCVRLYFFVCLFTRQIIKSKEAELPDSPLFWVPVTTIVEFIVYMGWSKVAEDMLHPLGETFGGNFECNHIIDTNLITGLSLVDSGAKPLPSLRKDAFWDSKTIAPLYTFETANRDIFTMTGTAATVNYVERVDRILMVPHKSKLIKMSQEEQDKSFKKVDVKKYNNKHKIFKKQQMNMDEDIIIKKLRRKANKEELDQMMVKPPLFEDVMLKL
uniref:Bestrophin homolog n=1 Tax=Panagrolaimus superbus TaxID=310955 RepID=A0A914Z9F3_9BILA